MKKQIASISLVQTAKVAAIIYFILGIVGFVFLLIATMVGARSGGIAIALLTPFLYAFFGFVFVFVGGWIYNQVAKRFGGVEFTVVDVRGEY